MDLLAYFRVLRRRWVLIVLVTAIGAALGAASTVLDRKSSDKKTYYRATSTLLYDSSNGDNQSQRQYDNPNIYPIFATIGDVPDNVAKKLGEGASGRELATRITTTLNREANTLDITAIDADAQRAGALADEFSKQLIDSLNAKEQNAYTQRLNQLSSRVASQQQQRDNLLAQVTQNPQDSFLARQYDAAANNYGRTYDQYLALLGSGAPSSALQVLEPAQPVPIGSSSYRTLLELGETGRNRLQAGGEAASSVQAASGSSFDDPVSRGVLGGLLGLLAGIGLALVADKLDRRIRTREDAEAAFELPVLAEVPRLTASQQRQHDVVAVTAPLSRAAEAYRAIRTSLLYQQTAALADRGPVAPPVAAGNGANPSDADADALFEPDQSGPLVVMVASASPGEGKTTTCANLAAVFGEAGSSVLLLNCDFRRPGAHQMFGLVDEPRTVQDTSVHGVKIVTNVLVNPTANPAQVVAAQRQVIAAARGRFDVVLLDTAPLLTANDAVEVVSTADLVVLVARPELSTTDNAQRALELLNRLDAPLAGVVLVAATAVANDYYYYYQRSRVPEPKRRRCHARQARSNGKVDEPAIETADLFPTPTEQAGDQQPS